MGSTLLIHLGQLRQVLVLLLHGLPASVAVFLALICVWLTHSFLHFCVTVRHRGIETGISEASKRVSIFSFATQGGK